VLIFLRNLDKRKSQTRIGFAPFPSLESSSMKGDFPESIIPGREMQQKTTRFASFRHAKASCLQSI